MTKKPFFATSAWEKVWATWWAICCGVGLVMYIFNHEERPWSFVGATIYFLLFLASLYQIKSNQSVFAWYLGYRKRRKEWREDPNNWSV